VSAPPRAHSKVKLSRLREKPGSAVTVHPAAGRVGAAAGTLESQTVQAEGEARIGRDRELEELVARDRLLRSGRVGARQGVARLEAEHREAIIRDGELDVIFVRIRDAVAKGDVGRGRVISDGGRLVAGSRPARVRLGEGILLDRYDELLAVALSDDRRLKQLLAVQKTKSAQTLHAKPAGRWNPLTTADQNSSQGVGYKTGSVVLAKVAVRRSSPMRGEHIMASLSSR
jgi:hypothetical protein